MKLGKYDIREMNPFLIPVTTLTELTCSYADPKGVLFILACSRDNGISVVDGLSGGEPIRFFQKNKETST